MANQKQRRRRLKEKRHDYDLIEIDEEGVETVVRGVEDRPDRSRGKKGEKGAKRSRSARVPQPPNWRRVLKRTGIFAPVFFAAIMLLGRGSGQVTITAAALNTVLLMAIFAPMSYVMDSFTYRMYSRRQQRGK